MAKQLMSRPLRLYRRNHMRPRGRFRGRPRHAGPSQEGTLDGDASVADRKRTSTIHSSSIIYSGSGKGAGCLWWNVWTLQTIILTEAIYLLANIKLW